MSHAAFLSRAVAGLRESRPRELWFAAKAWFLALPVELSLHTLGLRRTIRWIEAIPTPRQPRPDAVGVATGEKLVGRAYRLHLLRGQCLPRSLVQYGLHRQEGTGARFIIGVRRTDGLAAHAWVEPATGEVGSPAFSVLYDRVADDHQPLPTRRSRPTS